MRLKQKTKNIIGGVLSLLFVICLIVIYQIHVIHGNQYKIKTITVDEDKSYLYPMLKSEQCKISEGESIFGFNAKEVSEFIKQKIHHIRNIEIIKRLPSEVAINVSHRIPIMRISGNLPYVTDDTGKVFMASKFNTSNEIFESIPILTDDSSVILNPGDSISGKSLIALNIIGKFNSITNPSFRITEIDVNDKLYLIIYTDKNKRVFIPWNHINNDENISTSIEIMVDAMFRGVDDPHSNLIILVNKKLCYFTNM